MRYPLVQTGMGWVAGPRLVAATSEAGGLGILASATMSLDELAAAIAEVKGRTNNPFGVNLRTDVADVHERIELMIETGARVASFAQAPNAALVTRCKEAGLFVMPTVGARRHAEKVAEWGVDAVIAQGGEGGGHTGTVPTTLLLPQVVDAVGDRVLVLGAGGFYNGRGLVAALSYGAAGVAMGTRFLLSAESRVPDAVKALYLGTPVTGTVVTTKVDGAPQRVVRTDLVDHLESQSWLRALPRALRSAYAFRKETGASIGSLLREGRAMKEGNELTWSQVVMAANAPVMTKAALVGGTDRRRRAAHGSGRGRDRLTADGRCHHRRHHERGGRRAAEVERLSAVAVRRGRIALGHAAQQVRHPLVRDAEQVGDARDALSLGAQRDDQRASQVAAGLGLTAQDRAHQLHGPGVVLVPEDRLPFAAVLPGQTHLGDALGQQALALGVLPQHGFELLECIEHFVRPGPAPVVVLVRHYVLSSSSPRFVTQFGRISGQHAVVSSNRGPFRADPEIWRHTRSLPYGGRSTRVTSPCQYPKRPASHTMRGLRHELACYLGVSD